MSDELTIDRAVDGKTAELTVGAVRELVERLDKLEQAEECDSCQAQIGELNAKVHELEQRPALPGPELLQALRANGVTRYKRGDLEIELSRGPGPVVDAPGLAQWLPEPEDTGPDKAAHEAGSTEAPEPGPAPKPKRCGACHEPEPGHKDGCWVAEAKRDSSPPEVSPDDQPPVEIDMAAVEEKLREQDAKRRGPAQ
jgi:hypothetical protein